MYTIGSTDWDDVMVVDAAGVELRFGKDALAAGLRGMAVKGVLGADVVAGVGVEDGV